MTLYLLIIVFGGTFVPDDFQVPETYQGSWFLMRPLTVEDAEKDYEAVMSSAAYLRKTLDWGWPKDDFSLEQNRKDLSDHQAHFQERKGFTYTVMTPNQDRVLGCVYIYPDKNHHAQVLFWLRADMAEKDPEFEKIIRKWIQSSWPFKTVTFPGRD